MSSQPCAGHTGSSVLELIGNTPVQLLTSVTRKLGLKGRLMAKLENLNPGGSMKDRVALHIIRSALASGDLCAGQSVVEVTSGNTGIGLAIVCKAMGHPFYAVMSKGNSPERAQMMRGFGAEVCLVDQAPGGEPGRVTGDDMARVKSTAAQLCSDLGAFFANQFENAANADAHYRTTGPEFWRQTHGEIDAFLAFAGTGGALGGMSRFLHEMRPSIRTYAVEPASAASLALACCCEAAHLIQGGGYGKPSLAHFTSDDINGYLTCTDEQAIQGARMLASEEGIFGGFSAGAHLHAAIELLKGKEEGNTVAFLVCDTGMKYLSTNLFP